MVVIIRRDAIVTESGVVGRTGSSSGMGREENRWCGGCDGLVNNVVVV